MQQIAIQNPDFQDNANPKEVAVLLSQLKNHPVQS